MSNINWPASYYLTAICWMAAWGWRVPLAMVWFHVADTCMWWANLIG